MVKYFETSHLARSLYLYTFEDSQWQNFLCGSKSNAKAKEE